MSEFGPKVLVMGAGASQNIFGEHLTNPALVAEEQARPLVTFYDPNPNVVIKEKLPNLNAAVRRGEVRLVHDMPDDEYEVAIIATASNHHAAATQAVLERHHKTPLFVLEKPLAASPEELAWFRNIEAWVQPTSITNEPFLVSFGVRALMGYAEEQEQAGNRLTEIRAWSSKRRLKNNPHGELGPFGVELPHTHGGASLIAGNPHGLGPEAIDENIYFADIDGIAGNDGNYMRFLSEGRTIHVAQGLGQFAMDGYGRMERTETPTPHRSVSLRFNDGQYLELDMEPAFPRSLSQPGYSVLHHYDARGEVISGVAIADDPRQDLARYILQRVRDPSMPNVEHVSMHDSLARSERLLALRRNTEVRRGVSLG